jgi:trk system potassium uptake protein TrkH
MKISFTAFWGGLVRLAEHTDPIRVVILGYLSYVLIGWALLCLPVSQAVPGVSALDHLFMATSAMSTTGLATVSTADTYTFFGELVILILIQAGGLGYMTLGSFMMLAIAGRLSPVHQRVSGTALSLPAGFELRQFVRLMVFFTFAVEAAGALVLYLTVFAPRGVAQPVWQSVFHSVSAFCTAGFGLFNDSFESYRGDRWLNLVLITLSYLGAIGFIVVTDVWHALTRPAVRVTLTTRIILLSTVCISAIGTVLFFLDEPSVQALPVGERWLVSWFQVMTASTTVGFNTVPIGGLSAGSLFLLLIVMMIGASPSGTGGGIKTTTVTALWAVMTSVIRRRREPVFLGREIPEIRVQSAVAGFLFYCLTLAGGIYAVALVETAPLADLMFECASALGTVGLSRGITGSLTDWGKFIIILLMFLGRIGPLGLGMAFFRAPQVPLPENPEEDVAI